MPKNSTEKPKDQLFTDIEKFTSSINFRELESKGLILNEYLHASAMRASELMKLLISDKRFLGEPTRQAFEKFLVDPTLKRLELCFSVGAIKGIFRMESLADVELRRLLILMSKLFSDIKKIQGPITRFEEYVMEKKKIR